MTTGASEDTEEWYWEIDENKFDAEWIVSKANPEITAAWFDYQCRVNNISFVDCYKFLLDRTALKSEVVSSHLPND